MEAIPPLPERRRRQSVFRDRQRRIGDAPDLETIQAYDWPMLERGFAHGAAAGLGGLPAANAVGEANAATGAALRGGLFRLGGDGVKGAITAGAQAAPPTSKDPAGALAELGRNADPAAHRRFRDGFLSDEGWGESVFRGEYERWRRAKEAAENDEKEFNEPEPTKAKRPLYDQYRRNRLRYPDY